MNQEELVHVLAKAAKELVRGMRERVQRDPDIADYIACFAKTIIEKEIKGVSGTTTVVPGAEKCQPNA